MTTTLSTYDTRNTKLTANDRRMTSHTTSVSNNCFCLFHGWHPIRSCHSCNKDFAFFELIDILGIDDNVSFTCCITRGCWQTFYNNIAITCI